MRKWFVWLVMPALLLGACSDEGDGPSAEDDPTGALVSAIEASAQEDAQSATVTLQSTPESLSAASEGSLTPELAETILGSSVTISATQAEDPADQAARLFLDVPDTEGAEVVLLGTDVYLRADVRGLVEAAGQSSATVDQFLQSPEVQQAPFLESAANGEFLKIEGAAELTGSTATQDIAGQQAKVLEAVGDAIREDAEVTSEGSDDVGERVTVSAPVRDLYQHVVDLAEELSGGVPPGSFPPESEVPEGDLTFDAWISDGRLAQLEFDIVALAEEFEGDVPEGVEDFAIRVALSTDVEEITAPEDAVTVTAEEIAALFFGGFEGGGDLPTEQPGGGGGGGQDICAIYEDLPPETFEGLPPSEIEQIEQLCPGITQ